MPVLEGPVDEKVTAAMSLATAAVVAQRDASAATPAALRALRARSLTTRDVGAFLGISHQRVQQIEKGPATA